MGLKKIRVLPDQYIVREGEVGETAFLVVSGGLVAEIKGKKIGKIETQVDFDRNVNNFQLLAPRSYTKFCIFDLIFH